MDSSGLSVDDRLTAETLDEVVNAAAGNATLDAPRPAPAGRPAAHRGRQRHAVQPLPRHRRGQGRGGSAPGQDGIAHRHQCAGGFRHRRQWQGADVLADLQQRRARPAAPRSTRWPPHCDRAGAARERGSPVTVGHTVDWDFAATVGAKLVRPAPPVTEYTRRQAIDQLAESARAAEGPVRDVTGLNEGAAITEARIVDRAEWVRAATESMRVMTGGEQGGATPAAAVLTRRVTGAQTGAVLAFVSSGILGQYDPFASAGRATGSASCCWCTRT